MDRRELNEMFDGLAPAPGRERELLQRLLQEDTRRSKPVKNWKRIVVGVTAAALLLTTVAAAAVPGLSQKLLAYLGVGPENTQAAGLLAPGAMAVDITVEDNGAALHVSQVLRDRTSVMVAMEFTAPEGTSLRMGSTNPKVVSADMGFDGDPGGFAFLDRDGNRIETSYGGLWRVLEDGDPLDNHLSLLFVATQGRQLMEEAVSVRVPANTLYYSDMDEDGRLKRVEVYSGDWSVEVPLPQRDIGYVQRVDRSIGTLDGADLILEEVYVSPMALDLKLRREGGADFVGAALDEAGEAAYGRWLSIGENPKRIILTTGDGVVVPLECGVGTFGSYEEKEAVHRLAEITDPARFQGGTLTLEWDFYNSEESGSVTIPLDGLAPVEP